MRELGDDVTYGHTDRRTQPFIVKDNQIKLRLKHVVIVKILTLPC